jgi:N-methylhydantoinase A/oxoprolinase/acetone carboxylase beta subunit
VAGETVEARVVSRATLRPGDEVHGPALIEQSDTTTLLAPDERAEVDEAHNLVVHLS